MRKITGTLCDDLQSSFHILKLRQHLRNVERVGWGKAALIGDYFLHENIYHITVIVPGPGA
jgi:hypothetical protein